MTVHDLESWRRRGLARTWSTRTGRSEAYERSLTGWVMDSPKKMTSGFCVVLWRFSSWHSGHSGTTNWSYRVPSGRTTCGRLG